MNPVKKHKYATMYMNMAKEAAKMSHCERRKVGCVIVKEGRIISMGWNGMPAGFANVCETSDDTTKPEVLHAESNAIAKLAKSSESGDGAEIYSTTIPCIDCAKLIVQTGIKEVWYVEDYRKDDGHKFLERCGVEVNKLEK